MSVYATEEFVEFSRKRAELNAVIKAEGEDFRKAMDAFKARRKELEDQGAAMDGGWEKFAAQYAEKEKASAALHAKANEGKAEKTGK